MNRYAPALVGGLIGLATGLVFVHPLSAFLGTTTVTWDASNCPTGIYTITALARATSDTKFYSVTTSNVSLPKASIVQQFEDLPSGSYQVSATAAANNGTTFQSQPLTVTSSGTGGGTSGGGGGGGVVVLGRSRPPNTPAIGLARSRKEPPPADPPKPPTDKRLAPDAVPTPAPVADALQRTDTSFESHTRRLIALLAQDSIGMDRQWRRVDVVDDDEDGSIDYIAVEFASGEIWVFRFHGS